MQVVIWVCCFVAETPDRDFAKAESFDGWILENLCLLVG